MPDVPGTGSLVAGVDIGGTKIHVRVAGEDGKQDDIVVATPWRSAPYRERAEALRRLLDTAVPPGARLSALAVGAHGCDSTAECEEFESLLAPLVDVPLIVRNDAELLLPAAGLASGAGVIAGTGSIAVGYDQTGQLLTAGGWGWLLGDEGSAAGLVREAARAVFDAWDRGNRADALIAELLGAFGVTHVALLSQAMAAATSAPDWARHADRVFAAAQAGSLLARRVIDEGGQALARLVDRLGERGADVSQIAVGGGVIAHQPSLFDAFSDAVRHLYPASVIRLVEVPPVEGAIVLARRLAAIAQRGACDPDGSAARLHPNASAHLPVSGPDAAEQRRSHVSAMSSPAYDLRELPRELPVVPSKHPGRWISGVLVLAVVVLICYAVFSSKSIQWSAIPQYLTNSSILSGLTVTIWLTFASMAIGIVGGILLAVMRMSPNLVLKTVSGVYVWLFRGTPLLVQIIFWFNIALFVPRVHLLGINVSTNSLISPYTAALLALGLNEAAYMSEIVRGGLLSVDPGQHEAALAMGLTPRQTLRKVVLPQAMRAIVPPTSNQIIGMLKTTSLVSVVAAQELLTKAEAIYATNFLTIELLMVASIWYLALTTVGSVIQYFVERHYARGTTSARMETVWQRIARNLVPGSGRLLSASRSGS